MNGAHALAALAPDLPPLLADTPIEQRIGTAMADAAAAIAIGLSNLAEVGQICSAVKQHGGAALAAVVELQLDYFGSDSEFSAVARREGRKTLDLRHGPMLRDRLGPVKVDAAFDDLIGHALKIAQLVVDDERTLAH